MHTPVNAKEIPTQRYAASRSLKTSAMAIAVMIGLSATTKAVRLAGMSSSAPKKNRL